MAKYSTPTKSNLINARNSLKMATQGYDMLDLKRKLLMRELAKQADQEKKIQKELRDTLAAAEAALRESNVRMGLDRVAALAASIPEVHDIDIKFYSVMGVEIPVVRRNSRQERKPHMSVRCIATRHNTLWIATMVLRTLLYIVLRPRKKYWRTNSCAIRSSLR